MIKRGNRFVRLMALLLLTLSLLAGCGSGEVPAEAGTEERETVSVALWSEQLIVNYAPYLQAAFPEVDFEFYAVTNSTDFYRFREAHGDLPDILTVRRFALSDVAEWKDSLLDLSDTELANAFHQSYLRSYTYDDGTVNWLPACAEVDGIVANRRLLEENGLALPEDYQSFVELCGALEEKGIRPFLSNFSADFTCMELLQGLSITQLTSQEGREWRQRYESGQTDQLSEAVWMPVFQRMEDFIGYAGLTAADAGWEHLDVLTLFQEDELAMMRGTGNESAIRDSVDGEHVLLPYFGETENWYLTYPAFQVAASVRGTEREERRQLILEIMTAMLNQNGQEKIASGQNMIPYTRDTELELSPELANMKPYIDENRLYIRLASSDMFSVSKTVVQGMLDGTYPDARSAFDAFNSLMARKTAADDPAIRLDAGYPHAFDPRHGSQAASAVMNTVREAVGTQLLIGSAASVAGNIPAGDYTQAELGFLTTGETTDVLLCEMSGEQIRQYLDYVLTVPGKRASVLNDNALYVSSGFEMAVEKTAAGYALEELSIDGQVLEPQAVYSVALVGSTSQLLEEALAAVGVPDYTKWEAGFRQVLTDRLLAEEGFAPPTDYITLHDEPAGMTG